MDVDAEALRAKNPALADFMDNPPVTQPRAPLHLDIMECAGITVAGNLGAKGVNTTLTAAQAFVPYAFLMPKHCWNHL